MLGFVSILALPAALHALARFPDLPLGLVAAASSGVALCGLALVDPEAWLQASLLLLLVTWGARRSGRLGWRTLLLAVGPGIGGPLALGLVLSALDADSRSVLVGSLGRWPCDLSALPRLAQWLSLAAALLVLTRPDGALPVSSGRLALALPGLALLGVVAVRVFYVLSALSLPTDLLIWSEPPLLINQLKLGAGEVLYGPMANLNSYQYSPAVDGLQYWLLRPWGLELSIRAHRALGLVWQLLAAFGLYRALVARHWPASFGARTALLFGCVGVVFSNLMTPFLHPDHLLCLSLGWALWLVSRDRAPSRQDLLLLVALPVLATTAKLTGAGLGLGLVLAYAWERDFRRVRWLALGGVLALSTIPLFDATLGQFSDYAIRLQAQHPIDWGRARAAWARPEVLALGLAAIATGLAVRAAPHASAARAARRVLFVTLGLGLTSFVAYAKHGGRDNSLFPLSVGATVCLLLALSASYRPGALSAQGTSPALVALLAALLALVTPSRGPILGGERAQLLGMHTAAVSWLSTHGDGSIVSASIAAYIEAGKRRVPPVSFSALDELALAGRPEPQLFAERVKRGYYDGFFFTASSLLESPMLFGLRADLARHYVVVAPVELGGAWPTRVSHYVIAERRKPQAADALP